MNFQKVQRVIGKVNLRAASALLIFLLSWLAAPAALWAQEPDTCSMECCVAEGHCCCATAKLFVEGQDHSGVREIAPPEIFTPCQQLTPPLSDAKVLSRQIATNQPHSHTPDSQLLPKHHREECFYHSPRFSPDSSRAPPAILL